MMLSGATAWIVFVVVVFVKSLMIVHFPVTRTPTNSVPGWSFAFGVPDSTPVDDSFNPLGSSTALHFSVVA